MFGISLLFIVFAISIWAMIYWRNLKEENKAEPQQPAATINRTDLLRQINNIVQGFSCADLNTELLDDYELNIKGHISDAADRTRLIDQLSTLTSLKLKSIDIKTDVASFCKPLAFFNSYRRAANRISQSLTLEFNNPDGAYRNREFLIITIKNTGTFRGYLYVDFYDGSGNVIYMLPTYQIPENNLKIGNSVILGAADKTGKSAYDTYEIVPPFGTQMIAAIFCESLLYSGVRPVQENEDTYYGFLEPRLYEIAANEKFDLMLRFFTTRDMQPNEQTPPWSIRTNKSQYS